MGHRLWLPAVAIHRLGVIEIATSPHHCFRTAHPCAQSVKGSPTEPVLSRSSRQRLGYLQSHSIDYDVLSVGRGSGTPRAASHFIKTNRNWLLEQVETITDHFSNPYVRNTEVSRPSQTTSLIRMYAIVNI